jgi:5-methylcytosine-specific restriction endonuclease McrA
MKRRKLTEDRKDIIGRKCINCGAVEDLQYHHVIPIAVGGNDIDSNMVCLCGDCHKKLHNITDANHIAHSLLIKKE